MGQPKDSQTGEATMRTNSCPRAELGGPKTLPQNHGIPSADRQALGTTSRLSVSVVSLSMQNASPHRISLVD
jgi:hypothetical protein